MDEILELLLEPDMASIHDDLSVRKMIKIAMIEAMVEAETVVPWHRAIFMATEPTKVLLTFSIMKWIDPERPIDILVGDASNPGWSLVDDGYFQVGKGGKYPVCSGSRLYEDESLYRWIPDRSIVMREVDSCPLPEGKDKIMKWLYMTRAMNDDVVDDINDLVTSCLELGSDFFNMIVESPVLDENWKIPLILSILKHKAIMVANDVLHAYIPETCNVPDV